jgi:ketosteroid isomerase-like protein
MIGKFQPAKDPVMAGPNRRHVDFESGAKIGIKTCPNFVFSNGLKRTNAMKELEYLLDTYKNAVFQKDVEAFTALFDENVRVFDMWQRWSYEGLDAWQEIVRGWFSELGTNRDVITFDEIQTEAAGEMAVVSGFVRFTAVSEKGEELRYLEDRFSWVVRKKGDVWKIIHQHTSGPIDFETMKVMLRR